MKTFLALSLLVLSNLLFSQEKLLDKNIQIIIGRSLHSTGDMQGLSFATEYKSYFKKRLTWAVAIGGTIHDGFEPVFYSQSGRQVDGSIRYTAAGFQLSGHLGFNFIKTIKHELQLRAGPLLRYQSSSYFDELQIIYPVGTGLPMPVNSFINRTPQKTYAVGGSLQLLYNYTFNNTINIGFLGGFQADTNGDNISQLSLTLGKRF